MSKVLAALSVSVDGFITGRDPGPADHDRQTFTSTIEEAIAVAEEQAGDKDVGLMGGVVTAALEAGFVDEIVLHHQIPVLLGSGRRFFNELPEHISLDIVDVVPAPGVTHLHYRVIH